MSAEAPDRGPESGRQEAPAEVQGFSQEYIQSLHNLKDRISRQGASEDTEVKSRIERKVEDAVYRVLNAGSTSFVLVKSEIAKVNFLNSDGPALITAEMYEKFSASPEGRAFFRKVIELGTQALETQYTSGFQSEKTNFEKAQASIEGWEENPRPNANPTEKLIYQIAEKLGKSPTEITFDEAVQTGMMGTKPPSIKEIVKYGLSALEYANPKVDRKSWNEIQRRKRKVATMDSTDDLTVEKTDAVKEKAIKGIIENHEMGTAELNYIKQSLDPEIKKLVDDTLATKDGDLRFYTVDGKSERLPDSKNGYPVFRADKNPMIVVYYKDQPVSAVIVGVRNGRPGFEYRSNGHNIGFLDANVKKDRDQLLKGIKADIDELALPDKKVAPKAAGKSAASPAAGPSVKPSAKPTDKRELGDPGEFLKGFENAEKIALTAENIGKLIIELRKNQPNLNLVSRTKIYGINYNGKSGGLRMRRVVDSTQNNLYIADFVFPPDKPNSAMVHEGINYQVEDKDTDNMRTGKFLYDEMVAVIEGRSVVSGILKKYAPQEGKLAEEINNAPKVNAEYLSQIVEKMDKDHPVSEPVHFTKPVQLEFTVNYKGRPARLSIRREITSAKAEGLDPKKGDFMKYSTAIMYAGTTKPYGASFLTDYTLDNDWEDLGSKLYKQLESAVDDRKK